MCHLIIKLLVLNLCIALSINLNAQVSGESSEQDSQTEITETPNPEDLIKEADSLGMNKMFPEAIKKFDEASLIFLNEGNLERFRFCNQKIEKIYSRYRLEGRFEYFEERIEFCKAKLGEEHLEVGIWYFWLAELHHDVNNFKEAEENIAKSLSIVRKTLPPGSYWEGLNYERLGLIKLGQAEFKAAEENFNKTIEIFTAIRDTSSVKDKWDITLAGNLTNLGIIKKEAGRYEEAISNYQESVEIFKKYKKDRQLGLTYYNIGNAYLYLKKPQKAKDYLQIAIPHYIKARGENHPTIANVYNLIGVTEQQLFNEEEAVRNFEKALDINKKSYEPNHLAVGFPMINLGFMYFEIGEYEKAEASFQRGKEIVEHNFSTPHPAKASTYAGLCRLWTKQGIKLDSAFVLISKALEETIALHGEIHPNLAIQYDLAAFNLVKQAKYEEALDYAQKSLIAGTYDFEDSDWSANPALDNFIDVTNGILGFTRKAESFGLLWERDKMNDSLMEETIKCLDLNTRLMTDVIKWLGDQPLFDEDFHTGFDRASSDALSQHFDFYQHYKDPIFIEHFYNWMEKIKGRELLKASQKAEALSFGKIPAELIEKDKELSQEIDSFEKLLIEARKNKDSVAIASIQNESLFEAKRNRDAFIADLEVNYPDYYQLKYDFEYTKLADLKKYIDENSLYLEISLDAEKKSKNLFFLTITTEGEHIYRKDFDESWEKKINTFHRLLRSHNLLRADRRRKFIQLSHELYNQFIEPIEDQLLGKDRLIIIGEGFTNYIPFEVLLKSKEDKPWDELDFLVKNYEVSYHYSGTMFARSQEMAPQFEQELLAFAPVFMEEGGELLASLRDQTRYFQDTTLRSIEGDYFAPLIHSETEVKGIQSLFPENTKMNLLLHQHATEANLKSALQSNFRFVHLASHSFANIDYPKFSGIACASNSETSNDGILHVGEIYNLDVNSDLVVLSSCESGVGKLVNGEGMLGLNRSFVYAGVPNVVFSLWKVYDEASSTMMQHFYSAVLSGKSYSNALRSAKLKMLENPTTATPDIWGAFMLVGR